MSDMSARVYLNDNWKFTPQYSDRITEASFDDTSLETVRIPHTVKETPFNYFSEKEYQCVSGYRRKLMVPAEMEGKTVRLIFEGAAHEATVYVNEKKMISHRCGYTAFEVDITRAIKYGAENIIAVRLDSGEELNQPPFGFVIDYMTYGGIYRDVYLEISEQVYISDIFLKSDAEKTKKLISDIEVVNPDNRRLLARQYLVDKEMDVNILISSEMFSGNRVTLTSGELNVKLWDINNPNIYEIKTTIEDPVEELLIDDKTVSFGFRSIEFRSDGFFLNGEMVKIRGLNRHQSFPYVGYAMPDSMQRFDAQILKKELGVNAVRTSHYPQSHAFIDECDRLGLLVFTEIPGWQHIGDDAWKDLAVENTVEMVKQYRNHPSIVLWGVRINESADDDEFYIRTNRAAHELDPTRPTGGVRCYKKSHLFEDVYTYNDFLHDGRAPGCERKKNVSPDMSKPYLISEYNGHMYPTKAFDSEEHRREHALRHANVLNAVAGENDIAGSFGWCMFDYNTHKDFGSGDRICYHGVMDMFRNPKPAAYIYEAEGREDVFLELSSSMDIGEHPGCNRGDTFIYSNADSVRMYKNDRFIKEYFPKDSAYKNLKHGPIRIDDYIGDAIEKGENFKKGQVKRTKEILNAAALYGMGNLPKSVWIKAAGLMLRYRMNFGDAVSLYNKYVGDWGGTSTEYRFEAIKDGEVVKSVTKCPTNGIHLTAEASTPELTEGKSYDVASIRIRAVDDYGNQVFFFNEPVSLEVSGNLELIGPECTCLKGGMGGTYVKTKGTPGTGKLIIKNSQCEPVELEFKVEMKEGYV